MADPRRGMRFFQSLRWPNWLARLAGLGIVTGDSEIARRQRFVNLAAFVGALDTLSHAAYNSVYDFAALLPVNIYNVAMATLMVLTPLLHRHGQNFGALYLVGLIGFGNLYVIWSLGFEGGTMVYYTTCLLYQSDAADYLRRRVVGRRRSMTHTT